MPSGLAYLYGDLLQDVFASSARVSLGEQLPCRQVSVKKLDLATLVLVTACVYWAEQGCLQFSLGTKGLLKSRYVLTRRTTKAAPRLEGLESQVLANVTGREKGDGVASVVERVLRKDHVDPWGAVIREVQHYLVVPGYYAEAERRGVGKLLGKELVPQCDKIATLQGDVAGVHSMLEGFRSAQSELYSQLWKDVGAGITSRQETPENDFA
jgi:hypothetical protein